MAGKHLAQSRCAASSAVLLDIGMPEMDGYAVARRLRQDASTNGALLIAVSGYGSDADRARSAQAGFDHHFTKPVDVAALVEVLRGSAPTASPDA